jgi:integration host factor subunit beta
MNSSELIRLMTRRQKEFNTKDVEHGVRFILKVLGEALRNKQTIELRGFGTFSVRRYAAGYHRNPRTGERVRLGVRYLPHFKPSMKLRKRINTHRGW